MPLTAKDRTKQLKAWVEKMFTPHVSIQITSAAVAKVASRDLGFKVNANTMSRALQQYQVPFKMTENDPKRVYSKLDILKAQVEHMWKQVQELQLRVRVLEGKRKKQPAG